MDIRTAACSCGQLRAICSGFPLRISMCHCLDGQQCTGAPFGAQSRFKREQVPVEGLSSTYTRGADSGNNVSFYFCLAADRRCIGSRMATPGPISIALGAFADPTYPTPSHSVYEPWRQTHNCNVMDRRIRMQVCKLSPRMPLLLPSSSRLR